MTYGSEYKIDNKPVDYALFRPEDKPAAALEAKKLASHWMQMLNYAVVQRETKTRL